MSIRLVNKINNLFFDGFLFTRLVFSAILTEGKMQNAPVAQLDRVLDSDVSDRFRSDMAQSLRASEIEAAEAKKSPVVDYYLTTKSEKRKSLHCRCFPYMCL